MKLLAKAGLGSDTATIGALNGRVRVPGDKSISHRSIMLGALAEGQTRIAGFLQGADALATLNAFRAMGVDITEPVDGSLVVNGVGMQGLRAPAAALDLGNSGTSMRLLAGLLAGQRFSSVLTGDQSLSSRPMERVAKPLRQMGADVITDDGGCPPLTIHSSGKLKGIDYVLPMASAQVKSCLLLAGLYADGETVVTEPASTRDHTERMLRGFGYAVESENGRISLRGGGRLTACEIDIPADISSAAFFMVAASIVPGSEIVLPHVGVNPTRTGVIDILQLMGADISLQHQRTVGGEPVADIVVRGTTLQGIDIPARLVPLAIDEFPILFIAAACASGTTTLRGAEELRVKESDRIQAMVDGLIAMGVDAQGTPDGAVISGGLLGDRKQLTTINCRHDHRIAMAFAIASAASACDIEIEDCENIVTSFPNFVEQSCALGLRIEAK